MKSLSKSLVFACSLAGLASACATDVPTPAPPAPHPALRTPTVGGPCTYIDHPVTVTVGAVFPRSPGWRVIFALPLTRADIGGDFVGYVGGVGPSVGQTFPGVVRQETHGTCTPWVYSVMIDGAEVRLEPDN